MSKVTKNRVETMGMFGEARTETIDDQVDAQVESIRSNVGVSDGDDTFMSIPSASSVEGPFMSSVTSTSTSTEVVMTPSPSDSDRVIMKPSTPTPSNLSGGYIAGVIVSLWTAVYAAIKTILFSRAVYVVIIGIIVLIIARFEASMTPNVIWFKSHDAILYLDDVVDRIYVAKSSIKALLIPIIAEDYYAHWYAIILAKTRRVFSVSIESKGCVSVTMHDRNNAIFTNNRIYLNDPNNGPSTVVPIRYTPYRHCTVRDIAFEMYNIYTKTKYMMMSVNCQFITMWTIAQFVRGVDVPSANSIEGFGRAVKSLFGGRYHVDDVINANMQSASATILQGR